MNKRTVLIVDDNSVNRKILRKILSDDYQVIEAENGEAALTVLRKNSEVISALLLDIVMPVLDGYEVLRQMREEPALSKIPVIVTSGQNSEDAEIKALSLGANDYVLKPYKPAIIKHRIANTIYLRETAALINSAQTDTLTGLYTKAYFYVRVREILQSYPQRRFDLICCDIERFKLVNDLYGTETGDRLLRYTGDMIRQFIAGEGICARLGSDVFAFMVEHREEYSGQLFADSIAYVNRFQVNLHIVLRYGIYCIEDSSTPVNIMCDRACLAMQAIKGKYDTYYAYYDEATRQKLLDEQAITSGMKIALDEGQFQVYFQPKFDLKTERIVGAEALVRWLHPQKGFLSPGEFIPLFEKNGFITNLDLYVWEQSCRNLRAWMDAGHRATPVSVNVSRADLYHPQLPQILLSMLQKYRLDPQYLHLEITESAYTENPEQMVGVVQTLKKLGFMIEMDDFGTGYSSLNMLSELPIDILKLDIKFMQSEEKKGNSRSILSFIISLAKWLHLSVVAEGVETSAQVRLLRSFGCEYAQGFYYARPLPQAEFEALLLRSQIQSPGDLPERVLPAETAPADGEPPREMLMLDAAAADYRAFAPSFRKEYKITRVRSVPDAIDYLKRPQNQVAVLVINGSDIADLRQLENLQSECARCSIPALLIENAFNEKVEAALQIGLSDFILRPYAAKALSNRIDNVIYRIQVAQFQREKQINAAMLEMKKRAEEDSLTGLLNRTEFEVRMDAFFQNSKSLNGVFILLDVDHFKQINDTFGHVAGDTALRQVARTLRMILGEDNIAARMGGDEFALFVPHGFSALELREKTQKLCDALHFNVDYMPISCSAGVCTSPQHGLDYEQLYNSADIALLTAKRNGKNRYELFEPGMEAPLAPQLESKAALLLDDASDAMFVCDAVTSQIIYINETACQIIGQERKNCIGARCYQLFWDQCQNCDRCTRINACGSQFYEEDTCLKDQRTFVHIKAKLGDWDGKKVKIHYLQTMAAAET